MSQPPPIDEAARRRARTDLETSLVLEAGAGTGKTTLLVERIEALVRVDKATLDRIAAVTFTENAAATMKLRLRERFERSRADESLPLEERRRLAAALDVLERASISTIHALCAQILQERPLECAVVPGFRVADEAQSDALFAQAWEEWLNERLADEKDEVLLDALDRGIPLEDDGWGERSSLRGLARTLVEQRDLLPLLASEQPDWGRERDGLLQQAAHGAALAATAQAGDSLAVRLLELQAFAEAARGLAGPALEEHLLSMATVAQNLGQKGRWPSPEALTAARALAAWTKEERTRWSALASAHIHGRVVRSLQGVVASYVRRKTAAGLLDFLDLLLLARNALRDNPGVRSWFAARFPYLLIDEFQDTDPLQVEIAGLLAGERAGALVVVGDAKQSIYRFRRAEVRLFRELSSRARNEPGRAVLRLEQNFRSRPSIVSFVNRVFSALIQHSEEADQPPYDELAPPPGLGEEPAVIALRFDTPEPNATGADLLQAEARALGRCLAHVARGGETVRDLGSGERRPSRAGDVMVLARRLTQVGLLEGALEEAGLRFTVEGGKSFFDRQEVHETLAVLRAVEDPYDRVSLVAALRSSFFGVSDRDIVAYVLSGGVLGGVVDESLSGGEGLAPALELLAALHAQRRRASVPALLERLYDETRILAALTGTRRGEAQIANLEKIASLARVAQGQGALTLRGFTRLLEERVKSAREEPDLPSTRPGDPSTVRVLSIHKAKGLEAPVVALFDCADEARVSTDVVPLWSEGRIAVGFRRGCQPPGWDALTRREEKKAQAELRRLLYVACTRPRDLLIVPRPPSDALTGGFWREVVNALPAASDRDVRVVDAGKLPAPEPLLRREPVESSSAPGPDALAARWRERRRELLTSAAERPYQPVPATRLAARTAPPAVVAAGGAGGGRDFGSLLHRLLEWAPLAQTEAEREDALRAMAGALAPSMGLDETAAARAAQQAARALALPVFDRARGAERLWRELPLWFPDGEHLVEAQVDLVFEEAGALVVVDYKTDAITEAQALAQAAHHAPQLQLYGRGLARALERPVRERLVLFTAIGRTVPV
jgi:ATP-dependent helicase/nuclease subunit A